MQALRREDSDRHTARDIMRETIFVPEVASVNTLLQLFRARQRNPATVLDAYGAPLGWSRWTHYDIITGFILGRLARMAVVGDTISADGVRLRV